MAERIKRALLLIWRMLYPLLMYQVLAELTFAGYRQLRGEIPPENVLPLTAAGALLAVVPLGHLYSQLRTIDRSEQGKVNRVRRPDAAVTWLRCAAAGVVASLCGNNLLALLPLHAGQAEAAMELIGRPAFWIQMVCTAGILPLTEELIFRGLGYWRLRRELSFWAAAICSAVFFGLYHGSLYQGIYAGLLGLLLAALFEWTDSLFAVWAFHAAANLISIVVNEISQRQEVLEQKPVRLAMVMLPGILLAWLLYKLREDGRKHEITIHSNSLL